MKTFNRRDEPLTSEDMTVCNHVLDELCRELGLVNDKIVVARLASIIIELYRQGVRDQDQLKLLAGATRK
jgi:hypothetical protein